MKSICITLRYSKRILVIFEYKMRREDFNSGAYLLIQGVFDLPELKENARKNTYTVYEKAYGKSDRIVNALREKNIFLLFFMTLSERTRY
jgi:hypothetical protein